MSVLPRTFAVVRTVHVHLTLASFVALLFFAVTGILLVHSERLGLDDVRRTTWHGELEREVLEKGDRLVIVERLRALGAFGQVEAYERGEEELHVAFARPAARAEATVVLATGAVTITGEGHSWLAVLGDLHKGKQSASFWIVIDVAGVLWSVAALTGIVLFCQLRKRRGAGLAWLAIGTAASAGATWWLVAW